MPKLISDAKEKILAVARKQLFENGYPGLALREVASQSSMAVGTIYNYFPSKDMLVASIMAQDWQLSLITMSKACEVATSVEQGVKAIYDAIREYVKLYEPIWNEYKGVAVGFGERHRMLRNQLSDQMIDLLERLGHKKESGLCPLLAETILACAMQNDIPYSVLSDMVTRLFE